MTTQTFRIPADSLTELTALVGKLGKRAAKLGLPAPTVATFPAEPFEVTEGEGALRVTRLIEAVMVELEHTAVQLPGWQFLARVEPVDPANPGSGNLIYGLPGAPVAADPRYASLPIGCDHCRAARRRNAAFVLLEEASGSQRQVGSTCLADYLGHQDAERLAGYLEAMAGVIAAFEGAEADEGRSSGGYLEAGLALDDVLAVTSVAISQLGWLSATAARAHEGLRPTRDVVEVVLGGDRRRLEHDPDARQVYEALRDGAGADREELERAIDWAASLPEGDGDGYLLNLRTLAQAGVVRRRAVGIACSLLPSYRRTVERELRRALDRQGAVSEHLGEVGAKLTVQGALVGLSYHESDWGVRTRVQVRTDGGPVVVWWASSSIGGFELGERVELSGTVKALEAFQGTKTTVLTRARLRPLAKASA